MLFAGELSLGEQSLVKLTLGFRLLQRFAILKNKSTFESVIYFEDIRRPELVEMIWKHFLHGIKVHPIKEIRLPRKDYICNKLV